MVVAWLAATVESVAVIFDVAVDASTASKCTDLVFISHNTDFGDAHERESDDPTYFYNFSVEGYAIGINILLYTMTH